MNVLQKREFFVFRVSLSKAGRWLKLWRTTFA